MKQLTRALAIATALSVASGAQAAVDNIARGLAAKGRTVVSTSVSGAAISNATITNLTSKALTSGTWQCWGWMFTHPAGTTVTTTALVALSTTSGALPSTGPAESGGPTGQSAGTSTGINAGPVYFTGPTTVYVNGFVGYTTSTLTADAGVQCGHPQ